MITRIITKSLNPDVLMEQLVGLPIASVGWAGFVKNGDRRYEPFAEVSRVVGTSVSNGVRTEDVAQQGELRLATSRDLTATEQASLDSIITAHDATQRSTEQVRQDQDAADYGELRTLYDGADALTVLQANRMRKLMMRLLLRRERGEAI